MIQSALAEMVYVVIMVNSLVSDDLEHIFAFTVVSNGDILIN